MPHAEDLRLDLVQRRTKLKALGKGLKVARVYGTKILVETVQPYTEMDEYTQKGLHIPDSVRAAREAQVLPSTGIVLMLGGSLKDTESGGLNYYETVDGALDFFVKEGDMILFSRFAGSDHNIDGEQVKIIDITEILAVLETDEEIREVLAEEPKTE